ncbi:PepSY-associated TM helix domain-containing protein [Altericroceibacterium endophyticum]|uniref:PepSY domain-containing protein n=1 Tax=Altericroceibacterium endophyticum TaxID=1808508 RepID=A0A6I4T5F6_9SPHN|nr:PepSY-associated TM helix domain-containing protein [Altericroceibacterium endophyticum]MXO65918.1 PepSY domain-containing protein [Altericroceibacterium endophyticum]
MTDPLRPAMRKPLFSKGWVSAVLAGHSALGLAFSAAIYLICLTGSVVVFVEELERWEQPTAPKVVSVSPEVIDEGLAALREMGPKDAVRSVSATLPSAANPHFVLSARSGDRLNSGSWFADTSGQPVMKVRHDVSDFLVGLHINLHLPYGIGTVIVGLAGMALLALVISGILAHPRIIKDAFRLRSGGSARLSQADLHNRIGTWGLPFHLIMAFTAAFLGVFLIALGSVAATTYQGDMTKAFSDLTGPSARGAADAPRTDPVPPSASFIAAATEGVPGFTVQSVSIQQPGAKEQRIGIGLHDPRGLPLRESVLYDSKGNKVFGSDVAKRSFAQQVIFAIQPLHFGWFGGGFVKLAYGLLGLSMCSITATGIQIWLTRRRDKGRPAPIMERLWAATIWGQPLALTLAAIPSLATDAEGAPLLGWATGTIAAYALACVPFMQARLAAWLRAATAVALAGLALLHAAIGAAGGLSAVDPMSWAVDAALLLTAFFVARPMLKFRRATVEAPSL